MAAPRSRRAAAGTGPARAGPRRPSVVRVVGVAAAILETGAWRRLVGGRDRHVFARLGGMRCHGRGHAVDDGGTRGPAAGALAGLELDRDAGRKLTSHAAPPGVSLTPPSHHVQLNS